MNSTNLRIKVKCSSFGMTTLFIKKKPNADCVAIYKFSAFSCSVVIYVKVKVSLTRCPSPLFVCFVYVCNVYPDNGAFVLITVILGLIFETVKSVLKHLLYVQTTHNYYDNNRSKNKKVLCTPNEQQ